MAQCSCWSRQYGRTRRVAVCGSSSLSLLLAVLVVVSCLVSMVSSRPYTTKTYDTIVAEMDQMSRRYAGIVEVYTAQDRYNLESPGACSKAHPVCKQYILHISEPSINKDVEEKKPEVFFSGCLHGNEQVGPTATMEAAWLLVKAYACYYNLPTKAQDCQYEGLASSPAYVPWLARLVKTRNIYIMPMTNAWGYQHHQRTENGIDPNRDFPYHQAGTNCMKTIAARAVNELWREHAFQLAITFHAGMVAIAYEWGAPNHPHLKDQAGNWQDISPDDKAQVQVGKALSMFGGGFSVNGQRFASYPHNRMNNIVYAVDGGMEDWGYAGSWDAKDQQLCLPDTFGGYSKQKTRYTNDMLRVFNILVETSDDKMPSTEQLGSSDDVFNPSSADSGHTARNVRLVLATVDLVQPYILLTPLPVVPGDTSGGGGGESRGLRDKHMSHQLDHQNYHHRHELSDKYDDQNKRDHYSHANIQQQQQQQKQEQQQEEGHREHEQKSSTVWEFQEGQTELSYQLYQRQDQLQLQRSGDEERMQQQQQQRNETSRILQAMVNKKRQQPPLSQQGGKRGGARGGDDGGSRNDRYKDLLVLRQRERVQHQIEQQRQQEQGQQAVQQKEQAGGQIERGEHTGQGGQIEGGEHTGKGGQMTSSAETMMTLIWSVGGCVTVDSTYVVMAKLPAAVSLLTAEDRSVTQSQLLMESALTTEGVGVRSGSLGKGGGSGVDGARHSFIKTPVQSGEGRWGNPFATYKTVTGPLFNASISVSSLEDGSYFVVATAIVDQSWANGTEENGGTAMFPAGPPQSHFVNARTNPSWDRVVGSHRVVGQVSWYSEPLHFFVSGGAGRWINVGEEPSKLSPISPPLPLPLPRPLPAPPLTMPGAGQGEGLGGEKVGGQEQTSTEGKDGRGGGGGGGGKKGFNDMKDERGKGLYEAITLVGVISLIVMIYYVRSGSRPTVSAAASSYVTVPPDEDTENGSGGGGGGGGGASRAPRRSLEMSASVIHHPGGSVRDEIVHAR